MMHKCIASFLSVWAHTICPRATLANRCTFDTLSKVVTIHWLLEADWYILGNICVCRYVFYWNSFLPGSVCMANQLVCQATYVVQFSVHVNVPSKWLHWLVGGAIPEYFSIKWLVHLTTLTPENPRNSKNCRDPLGSQPIRFELWKVLQYCRAGIHTIFHGVPRYWSLFSTSLDY